MNSINCEEIILAKMTLIDGEESLVSIEEIKAHSAQCKSCRQEIAELENTMYLFAEHKRQEQKAALWSKIDERLYARAKTDSQSQWKIFLGLGAALIVYKLLEMIPENDLGFLFKFAPLILAVGVFLLLKENPFKINTELSLER